MAIDQTNLIVLHKWLDQRFDEVVSGVRFRIQLAGFSSLVGFQLARNAVSWRGQPVSLGFDQNLRILTVVNRIGVMGLTSTVPFGISLSGVIVGFADTANSQFNFAFERGKYETLMLGGTLGVVLGINPQATALVGYSEAGSGFLYQNGTLTTLQFPGATSTVAIGVNRFGQVVGYFADPAGYRHGFLWTPSADLAANSK